VLFAIGTVATILTSAELGKQREAREPEQISESPRSVALRLVAWGGVLGGLLGAAQLAALPMLRLFTPLEEVRRAARAPSIIGSILQLINGVVFVGEGVMVGAGAFPSLAAGQVAATASFLLALRLAPPSLVSVWFCFWLFNGVRLASFVRYFWFGKGPLAKRGREEPESESGAHD
jgi:Na+-driven multidrug efflux pump